MDEVLNEAAGLVEGLRYVEDIELIDEDVVGCAASANDVVITTSHGTHVAGTVE